MKYKDGVIVANRVKNYFSYNTNSGVLSIGGLGGEISRGLYYQSESAYKKILSNKYFYEGNVGLHLEDKYKTNQGNLVRDILVSELRSEYFALGLDRFGLNDYIYFREKFVR